MQHVVREYLQMPFKGEELKAVHMHATQAMLTWAAYICVVFSYDENNLQAYKIS